MKKKKRWPLVAVLWILFLLTVSGVVFLSFENGDDAKELGSGIIEAIASARHPGVSVTEEELEDLTYVIRQAGRVLAFVVIGIIGTVTIHVTCRRRGWILKTIITAGILFSIAYLTEKLKVYIPSRHYSYDEMMLSMVAVACGFTLVSVITLFGAIKKSASGWTAASHS